MKISFNKISKVLIILSLFFCFYVNFYLRTNINSHKYRINTFNITKLNKIIIVGDSRMELIDNDRSNLNLPNSIIFDAKSGASIDWFYNDGIQKLYKLVNNINSNYEYHVIFNMGINDLAEDLDVEKRASEYYNLYKKIINLNQNINFYFLSVNPIDEKILFSSDLPYYNSRTNKKVKKFNNYFIKKIQDEKLSNVKYCDSYNSLSFVLPDGLHYDFNTNKKIISYIISECIE